MFPVPDDSGTKRPEPAAQRAAQSRRRIDCSPRERQSPPPDPETSRGRGTPDRSSSSEDRARFRA